MASLLDFEESATKGTAFLNVDNRSLHLARAPSLMNGRCAESATPEANAGSVALSWRGMLRFRGRKTQTAR